MQKRLVGRSAELAALRADFDAALAGHGRLVTIRGDLGIGKTSLAQALADHARQHGAYVVWMSAVVPADAPPAWPWPSIVRACGDDALAEVLETRPLGPRSFEDVVATIVRAAARRPLMIVLDDAGTMADAGRQLLAFAGAQLALQPVLLVATTQAGPAEDEHAGTTLVLHGLAEPAVGELLRDRGITAEADVVHIVHTGASGNPADVLALVPSLPTHPTEDDAIDVVLTHAEREAERGGRRAAERWLRHARDLAQSPEHGARVALLSHDLGATTSVSDDDRIALLQRAGELVVDPALRAKVLAATAREAYHIDAARQLGDPKQLVDEALALARRSGDPDALACCLLAQHDTEWRPGSAARRLELADEIVELAPHPDGVLARYVAYLELGDRRADREFDRFVQTATRHGGAHARYLLCTRRAMRALMTGDLANAQHLIDEGLRLARRYDEPDGVVVALNQRFELHSEHGTRAELLPMLERAREFSSHGAIAASLALARLDAGDRPGAETLVAPFTTVDLSLVKPEYGRAWVVSMLGEAFAQLGFDDAVERALDALLPLVGTNIVVGGGVVFHGAVDHHVGTLLAARGRMDAAEPHLRAALAMHERLGASPWVARTADALGERARTTERRAGSGDGTDATMAFDGALWTITFAGTTVTMKDAKGLQDVARLVQAAGTEISAAELAGAEQEARLGADPTLDDAARRAYRARIAVVEESIERADRAGDRAASEAAVAERDALLHELAAASGLAGRDRRLGDASERARKAVSARIRDTIRHLDERHPVLAAHLREAVVTGAQCCYQPVPPVAWQVRQIRPST